MNESKLLIMDEIARLTLGEAIAAGKKVYEAFGQCGTGWASPEKKVKVLREALSDCVDLIANTPRGSFSNGVTDPSGNDEGETIAGRILGSAKQALAATATED